MRAPSLPPDGGFRQPVRPLWLLPTSGILQGGGFEMDLSWAGGKGTLRLCLYFSTTPCPTDTLPALLPLFPLLVAGVSLSAARTGRTQRLQAKWEAKETPRRREKLCFVSKAESPAARCLRTRVQPGAPAKEAAM